MRAHLAKAAQLKQREPIVRREPVQMRSQARVRRILGAAVELIARGGLAAVTTNALAKAAKIPVGTLYQFFPNREAVLQVLLQQQLIEFNDHLVPLLAASQDKQALPEQVGQVVDALAVAYGKVPGLAALLQLRSDPALAKIASDNNEWLAEILSGLFLRRAPRAPKGLARAVGVTVIESADAVLMAWLRTGDKALLVELKRLLTAYSQAVLKA